MTEPRLPEGFQFAGVPCGIKPEKPDLALIVSDGPVVAAGVYTQNLVRAACIDWNRSITPTSQLRGLVVNSGNANACTGKQGVADNREMARALSVLIARRDSSSMATGGKTAGSSAPSGDDCAVLSTGVIGRPMPMERVQAGIAQAFGQLGSGQNDFNAAATAIMTTDHRCKTVVRNGWAGSLPFSVAAMAKGAGMIGPAMATMLAIVTTDFPLDQTQADELLRVAVNQSFNRISVEGHTSTNDACLLMARPAAGRLSTAGQREAFQEVLNEVTLELAKMIPADGEGATHLIQIRVLGCSSAAGADRIARTIALSNLVKTAVAGADPNWGRIVSAAGYSGVDFDVSQTSLTINGHRLFSEGEPVPFDPPSVSQAIREPFETQVELVVGTGPGEAVHYTSDLTADYVRLNADYTT